MTTATTEPGAGRRVTPTAVLVLPATADRDDWLAARRSGIGSSDIPKVMGVSSFGTPLHIYHEKRGELAERDDDSEAALWGRLHEETVAREWARRNRSVVRRVGVVAHTDARWQMCTLDRRVTECPLRRDERERCALEVKTRNAFVAGKWRRDVPDDVLAQVLWQIHVTGYDHIHVACLIGGNDFRQFVVRRDRDGNEDLIADIVTVAERLWQRIRDGSPPPPTGDPAALLDLDEQLHPDRGGDRWYHGTALAELLDELSAYETARLEEKAAKALKDAAKTRMVVRLDGAAAAHAPDGQIFAYEPSTRRNTDLERLAEHWPEAYADCVTDKPSPRLSIAKPYRLTDTET